MKFCTYKILNLQNGKFYIGVTSCEKKRWRTHILIAKGGKEKYPKHFQAIHSAIKKYGEKSFQFIVLEWFDRENDGYLKEQELIELYKKESPQLLYNIAGGGKGTGSGKDHPMYGKRLRPEWAEKVRLAISRTMQNPEVKQRLRESLCKRGWFGINHPMYGKKHTEATRKKISEKGKGRKVSEETKRLISERIKGRKISEETRIKIKQAKEKIDICGDKNPNYGNRWDDDKRKKMSEKKKGIPCSSRKLNQEDINKIFCLKQQGLSSRQIATTIKKVGRDSVKNILKGKHYVNFVRIYMEKL